MGIAYTATMNLIQKTPERLSEAALLAKCRNGDLEAFGKLYACYEGAVFRYAYHLLGHKEDADDIKQETFLRAYGAIEQFRGDAGIQTWLFRICHNLCRDKLKSWEKRNLAYDGGNAQEWERTDERLNPAHLAERAELSQMVLKALSGLSSSQREVIILHDVEEMDYAAMSEILGCSRVGVKLRVYRARKILRERVETMLK